MGHKTHVVGFRLGVPVAGELRGRGAYHAYEDIHGQGSRWVAGTRRQQAEWTQRDRQLRKAVEDWLLVEGYLVNKIRITRAATYVGVYVDAYRLEDRTLVTGIYGDARTVEVLLGEGGAAAGPVGEAVRAVAKEAAAAASGAPLGTVPLGTVPLARPGRRVLEELLSRHVEWGRPVRVQLVALNELLPLVPEAYRRSLQQALPRGKAGYSGDLRQVIALLGLVPCAPLVAKVVSYRLSGGRVQRTAYRQLKSLRRAHSTLALRKAVRGSGRRDRSEGGVTLGSRGAWQRERLELRGWSRGSLGRRVAGREVESSSSGVGRPGAVSAAPEAGALGVGAASVASGAPGVPASPKGVEEGYGYLGYYIRLKGRVAGSERSRKVVLRAGTLPRHQRSAGIDQGSAEANTSTGVVSVVVQVRVA